jgi:hypothetical protein
MKQVQLPKAARKAPTRAIPIEVHVPGAKKVVITGDFLQWTPQGVPLSYDGREVWRTALDLPPGEYQYRLIVDGAWSDHPQAAKRVPNPFGSENCVLVVG